MRLSSLVRARPVPAFFLLTFVITWGTWWPMAAYNRGWTDVHLPGLYFLGGLGPGIAAYVVVRILRGKAADAELLGALLRWRVGWAWYAVAVLLFPVIWMLAAALSATVATELAASGSVSAALLALLRYLLAAVPEELGWRGFALPALQARHTALTASLVVGLSWFAWHLPLVLGGDPVMSTYPLLPYAIWFLAQSVLYAWLYNNTGGSLVIAVLLHAIANVVGVFSAAPWATAGVTVAVTVIVVAVFGPAHLSRTGPRLTLPGTGPETRNRPRTDAPGAWPPWSSAVVPSPSPAPARAT